MAEGLLGGLLGGEEDRAEEEARSEARPGAEAFAAAIAADQAKHDPAVARATETFLEEQTRLLRAQKDELLEQRVMRMSYLRNQVREGDLRRFGQRIRNGLQVFTAVVFSAVGLGLCVMIVDAFTSNSVVIDTFKAPSALAAGGLTGDVVASGVLDELQKLRDATRSAYKSLNTKSAWSSDVKIEVPETGVSIGEINRLLHERFGHDIHIEGDLVQTQTGGIALTVRGDGVPAKTFLGALGELDKLTTSAAEYVYGRSQPYQFASYLNSKRRSQDNVNFLPGAFARAQTDAERAQLANSWGNAYSALGQVEPAIEKYRLSMSLAPRLSQAWWKAWGNLIIVLPEETGWREARAYLDVRTTTPKNQQPDLRLVANAANATWDLPLFIAAELANTARNGGAGAKTTLAGPVIADVYGLMHDQALAARYMASSDPDDPDTKTEAFLLADYAASDRGDGAAATTAMEAYWKAWKADIHQQSIPTDSPCLLGRAYSMTGRLADAEAAFKQATGEWSRCFAYHGEALERAGDLTTAERIWAQGLAAEPDLPFVYMIRGVSETNRNDFKAAEVDLAAASAKAPHFADPLKAWGDLLAKKGRWKDALAKYEEALKYAPAWLALHQVRDAAAGKS